MSSPLQSWLQFPDGRRLDLQGTVTVGRASENVLVLADGQISRRHAIIQPQGDAEFWLVDLGSANGSYLNGRRVAQPARLHRGDVIRLSAVEFIFQTEMLSSSHSKAGQMMASTMLSVKTSECWMLIADIVGATKLSQSLSAEDFPRVTGGWFKSCREVIEAHEGQIMKYLGDGFFCYWESKAASAEQVRGALADLQSIQAKGSPPFRIVLHYGQAVLGSVPTMAELNLHGPEVNFAFRIEKIAAELKLGLMLSGAANERIALSTRHVHTCSVDGFRGSFQFFSSELPRA